MVLFVQTVLLSSYPGVFYLYIYILYNSRHFSSILIVFLPIFNSILHLCRLSGMKLLNGDATLYLILITICEAVIYALSCKRKCALFNSIYFRVYSMYLLQISYTIVFRFNLTSIDEILSTMMWTDLLLLVIK